MKVELLSRSNLIQVFKMLVRIELTPRVLRLFAEFSIQEFSQLWKVEPQVTRSCLQGTICSREKHVCQTNHKAYSPNHNSLMIRSSLSNHYTNRCTRIWYNTSPDCLRHRTN